jgi:hypothetical protein
MAASVDHFPPTAVIGAGAAVAAGTNLLARVIGLRDQGCSVARFDQPDDDDAAVAVGDGSDEDDATVSVCGVAAYFDWIAAVRGAPKI